MPNSPRAARRREAAALATILLLAACSPTAPTGAPTFSFTASTQPSVPSSPAATPSGSEVPTAQVYGEIRSEVEAIRGLQPTADVDPVTIDETQLKTNLEAEFDKENRPEDLKFSEDTLILLGLLPAGSSIRAMTLDFQGSNVAGYYSPDAKQLFVVSRSGGIGAAEKVTYAHEFTHQLQDQHFDLSKLAVDATNQSDRALAQLALVEGDATSVQTTWTIQNLTPEELGELLGASFDPDAIAALQRAPAYLRETSMFPYTNGLNLVTALTSAGGYDHVDAAFRTPPDSTEQVLHPEKFIQREPPVMVTLPSALAKTMGAGWTEAGQDTLGELIIKLWLTQNGVPADALTAAAGWGGDRLVLLRGPAGAMTVGMRTEWDTSNDASEFASAAQTASAHLGQSRATRHTVGSKTVIVAIGVDADRLAKAVAR
jgi:hypothetical protein